MTEPISFKFEVLGEKPADHQVEQLVAMMQRMYEFHATLHADWQTKPNWQQGSAGWISRATGGGEFFFALAYAISSSPNCAGSFNQQPAGYVIASFHYEAPLFIQHRYGYIADLWVEEAFRGQRVAQTLLAVAHDWCKQQGVRRVQIEVDVENIAGLKFWKAAAYQPFETVLRRDI